jgi:hypothetical protein
MEVGALGDMEMFFIGHTQGMMDGDYMELKQQISRR